MTVPARLSNPIPLEALIQFQRHLLKIRKGAGYHYDIQDAAVNVEWRNLANAGVSGIRPAVIDLGWDLDSSRDLDAATRTNGITSWKSTAFLSGYLYVTDKDPLANQRARTYLHADLAKYFRPGPGVPNTAGIVNPWTLPTELGQPVIREFYISKLNHDPTFENRPIIKVDLELTLFWAALEGDLNYPK